MEEKIDELRKIDQVEGDKFREKLQKLIQDYENNIFNVKALIQLMASVGGEVEQILKDDVGETGLTSKQKALLWALKRYNETGVLRDKNLREMVDTIIDIAKKDMTVDWSDSEMLAAGIKVNIKNYLIEEGVHDVNTAQDIAKAILENLKVLYRDYVPEKVEVQHRR